MNGICIFVTQLVKNGLYPGIVFGGSKLTNDTLEPGEGVDQSLMMGDMGEDGREGWFLLECADLSLVIELIIQEALDIGLHGGFVGSRRRAQPYWEQMQGCKDGKADDGAASGCTRWERGGGKELGEGGRSTRDVPAGDALVHIHPRVRVAFVMEESSRVWARRG
jgi:hypothetical protein